MGPPGGLLRRLDAFPKVNQEFFSKTMSGGIVTIVSSVVMVLLLLSEISLYARTLTKHELVVDTSRGETIKIKFNITLPHMPCSWLSLDSMDVSGDVHLDVEHDVYKQRLDAQGRPVKDAEKHDVHSTKTEPKTDECGSCYGAEDAKGSCCNSCDEVRAAYRRRGWALANVNGIEQCKHDAYMDTIRGQTGEGCRMWGMLEVNKVAGNFHFAPGRSYQQGGSHIHDLAPFGDATMDFSHIIHTLSFGTPYPGMTNPLDSTRQIHPAKDVSERPGMYQYFLKVVPTSYTSLNNATHVATNQYSVTENFRPAKTSEGASGGSGVMSGLFVFYDLSPIKVRITEARTSFLHFLTSVCAIVGGVFTVAGIVDSLLYAGSRLVGKKQELGKFS